MPGRENSLTGESGAVKDSAGELKSCSQSTSGYPLNAAYEARLQGFFEGRASRQLEVDILQFQCDRFYTEMCRRPGKPFEDPNRPSYAQLEATRAAIYAGNK